MLERAAAIQKLVHHPSFGKIGRAAKNDERDPLDLLAVARKSATRFASARAASCASWLFKRLSA